jgi:hypothetical protein
MFGILGAHQRHCGSRSLAPFGRAVLARQCRSLSGAAKEASRKAKKEARRSGSGKAHEGHTASEEEAQREEWYSYDV